MSSNPPITIATRARTSPDDAGERLANGNDRVLPRVALGGEHDGGENDEGDDEQRNAGRGGDHPPAGGDNAERPGHDGPGLDEEPRSRRGNARRRRGGQQQQSGRENDEHQDQHRNHPTAGASDAPPARSGLIVAGRLTLESLREFGVPGAAGANRAIENIETRTDITERERAGDLIEAEHHDKEHREGRADNVVSVATEDQVPVPAGVVFDTGQFSLTADYFRIDVSDRIGITSNFTLTAEEIDTLLAAGVEAARDLRRFRFFTNAFSTASQGIDLVSTFTPLALRGNTAISAVFNYTDTEVTDNRKGLLNDRRLTEFAYALPRTRWNVGLTQQVGRVSILGRVNWFGGWYDYDSGFAQVFVPSGGIEQGFFDGRPIVDFEASIALGGGTTLAIGAQNVFNTYPDESARAMSVGERYSEYTPWGFNGAYYYVRVGYGWGN